MRWLFMTIAGLLVLVSGAQNRVYVPHSVLATGNWYKIAVAAPGVYKVDLALLSKLGMATGSISSASIRLYGNGGAMLPEACNGFKNDDLVENPIQVVDGGDGVFNGPDYFLFYAPGPDAWLKDSVHHRFSHQKNLYSRLSYYYITIGGNGKRIPAVTNTSPATVQVASFSERYFHELDSINFLSSGKEWYGEELSALPGHSATQNFNIPAGGILAEPALLVSNCIARTIGGGSRFNITANGNPVMQQDLAPTGNGNLDAFATGSVQSAAFTPAAANITISYGFTPGGINAQGWINWFELFFRRQLLINGNQQLLFRDWNSVGQGAIAGFHLQNGAAATVWDITNPLSPIQINGTPNGTELYFSNDASQLHEYVAFNSGFLLPEAVGRVNNQDLHGAPPAGLLVVVHPSLLPAAQQLAAFHRQRDPIAVAVVTTDQVYAEFASGSPDPSAIRDFVKMYYDRAGADTTKRPTYLLLFGAASFDYLSRLKNNTNLVPAYESGASLDPLSTYTSDDFYGFLDDNEDINSGLVLNLLDIGIGRIPAQTTAQADAYIAKVMNYVDPKSMGPWRNQQTFIADDGDFNLHFADAENITAAAAAVNPLFLQDKIYLDAYPQESTPAGARYPAVNEAINNQVQGGTLIWNYNGHGGYRRLAEEVILEQPIVDSWNNPWRLPLFITATCDFAPYDNPTINALGENILLREKTGGIALMTTTRLVFAYSNRIMNRNYLQAALQADASGKYPSLGTATMAAKNYTYQTQSDITNNRKFTLLGDPALTIAFPVKRVQTTAINNTAISVRPDTLKALGKYTITGMVTDLNGNPLTNFNGTVYATVFDKPKTVSTRGNAADSYKENFMVQNSRLFKGKATAVNGNFSFSFVVPSDINYQFGNGRISYYAENGSTDGNGSFTAFLVGGSGGVSNDKTGPEIRAFLNDENFVNGSIVNESPLLIVHLADSSGINTTGAGIGHDITATVDGNAKKAFVLNDFFEADKDSYQKGSLRFQLPALDEGMHSLAVRAWDAANNSGETTIQFRVLKQENLRLNHVLNYPNPFTTHTSFWFEHNRPGEDLRVGIQVFTVTGKLVKTIRQTINTSGNRSSEIQWNATDDFGDKLARGVYIYLLRVTGADGKSASKIEKLYIL